jgi:hypothetical protein
VVVERPSTTPALRATPPDQAATTPALRATPPVQEGRRPCARIGSRLAALVLSLTLCAAAAAEDWKYDGAELARFAADYEKLRDSGAATDDAGLAARVSYFTGFVLGVARANADRGWFCLPDDLLAWHAWDLVAQFVRDHPELLERRPTTLVNGALAKRYPCTEAARAAKKRNPEPPPPEAQPGVTTKPGS